MTDIVINISDPGTTFSAELFVIKRALASLGCEVSIVDQYPFDESRNSIEAHIERIKTLYAVRESGRSVSIVTNHQPWGWLTSVKFCVIMML